MTDTSLNRPVSALNLCDSLSESIHKAQALIDVATADNFSECSASVIHNYLWALDEFMLQVKTVSEQLCQECLKKGNGSDRETTG